MSAGGGFLHIDELLAQAHANARASSSSSTSNTSPSITINPNTLGVASDVSHLSLSLPTTSTHLTSLTSSSSSPSSSKSAALSSFFFATDDASASTDDDLMEITPLGGGREVGRSCLLLRFKGKTLLLDCGVHPAYTGMACLPFFDNVDDLDFADIDLLLVTHFHLDHAAAVPYLLTKTTFDGECYMTHPTKAVYKLILQDYVKVSSIYSQEEMLYTKEDLMTSMSKIKSINYKEKVTHKGISFWCYNAGHVLGAAMFMIEIAGVRIFYTGDYSRAEDRHLMAAEIPPMQPDVAIVESTYGTSTLPPIEEREKHFTDSVHAIMQRDGRCLIPVFALGRAQELLLMLDEYWTKHPRLQARPIYYASALAQKCMKVYKRFINMMNARIREQAADRNPFDFKHITAIKGNRKQFDTNAACVVMASPGMLQNGFSRELFDMWCSDRTNGVVIPGYSVVGTLAHELKSEPEMVTTLTGQRKRLQMSVHYVSFSAHADYAQTRDFVHAIRPQNLILVHGQKDKMRKLRVALQAIYSDGSMHIVDPDNGQTVQLTFRSRKTAKIVGKLAPSSIEEITGDADDAPDQDEDEEMQAPEQQTAAAAAAAAVSSSPTPQRKRKRKRKRLINGLLVMKDFKYTIMAPEEVADHTPLSSSTINQTMTVPYGQTHATLCDILSQMYEIEVLPDDETVYFDPDAITKAQQAHAAQQAAAAASGAKRTGGPAPPNEAQVEFKPLGPPIAVHRDIRLHVRKAKAPVDPRARRAAEAQDTASGAVTADHVLVEWPSNPVNDMIVDSLITLIMSIESSPGAAKIIGTLHACGNCKHSHRHKKHKHEHGHEPKSSKMEADEDEGEEEEEEREDPLLVAQRIAAVQRMLAMRFGDAVAESKDKPHVLTVRLDDSTAAIDAKTFSVTSDDPSFRQRVLQCLKWIRTTLSPISAPPPLPPPEPTPATTDADNDVNMLDGAATPPLDQVDPSTPPTPVPMDIDES